MALSPSPALKRNWADLDDGPAGLIADRLLAYDVAGYVRFRAVCREWRRCSADPRAHGSLDRRFHPRWWVLLLEELATPNRRRLLNTSTGEFVQVDLPELHDHDVLGVTAEGLLVLVHAHQPRATVRLLNPLTRHLTPLPPLTTLLPKNDHDLLSDTTFDHYFQAWGSGILDDDSTVVLSFHKLCIFGMAKPGDACWTLVLSDVTVKPSSLVFSGRLYCVTHNLGVMVLKNQPPRLEVAAKLPTRFAPGGSVHLVENAGELMLVHRRSWRVFGERRYAVYRVDLDAGNLCRVNSFGGAGGHALFIGMHCSLSVPVGVFSPGSISGDTIYPGSGFAEGDYIKAYHVGDKSTTYVASQNTAQPHTLVNCLSLCTTGRP
uniref:Uncharacterized protein n=1 Tax=Avena sativa TaxID=4498 RepID=A0ACD5XGH8_AVESA